MSQMGALAGPAGLVRYAGRSYELVSAHHPSVVVAPRVADAERVQAWVCGWWRGTAVTSHAVLR